MKHLIIFCLLILTNLSHAQRASVSEVKKVMSQGERPGLEIVFTKATAKEVEDHFQDKNKSYKGKYSKPEKGSFEYKAIGMKIPSMSSLSVDVYAIITQEGDNVRFTGFFVVEGNFVSSQNAAKYEQAKNFEIELFNKVYFDQLQEKIDDENKILKSFEKEQKNLEGDLKDYEKSIQKSKESIHESEGIIKENEGNKANNERRLDEQKALIKGKEAELKLHNKEMLETEKKNLEKEIKDMEKINDKLRSQIKDLQKDPGKNTQMLAAFEKQYDENSAKLFAKNNALNEKKAFFEANITVKEGELKAFNKEKDRMEDAIKDNKDNISDGNKNIAEQKAKIATNEANITDNRSKQSSKKNDIKTQSEKVAAIIKNQEQYK